MARPLLEGFPKPMTDEWLVGLKELFKECKTPQDMMESAYVLYRMRNCVDVWPNGLRMWRSRMNEIAPNQQGKTLAVADLPAVYFVAWSVSKDKPENIPNITVDLLRDIWREMRPDYFSVAMDSREYNCKSALCADYKADREERPKEFYIYRDIAIERVRGAGIPVWEERGLEADDIMCSAGLRAFMMGQQCVMVTEDRDMWQGLMPGVVIYSRSKKEFRNEQWLKAKHGITPKQAVDYHCMVGKNNIPGVEGVGKTTASKLLQAHGSFMGIIDFMISTEPKKKVRGQITENKRKSIQKYFENHYWDHQEIHRCSRMASVTWV